MNKVSIWLQGEPVVFTLDDRGVWRGPDEAIAADLNSMCNRGSVDSADPNRARLQMRCAVDYFGATIVDEDPPAPRVPDRVY